MRYLDLFSGVGTASIAFDPLGWQCLAHSEIDKFASAILRHRFPDVPNLGDINGFQEWPDYGSVDLVCGGSPCQAFSIAGLRAGLADPRGKLMLVYLAVVRRYMPRWIIWENVPGVLSLHRGQAFETLLRGLEELGYHAAWRVLDAQFTRVDGYPRAVPQRRGRVFLVGYLGDWRYPAQVLLEPESLRWNPAPRRDQGQGYSRDVAASLVGSGRGTERVGESRGQDDVIAVRTAAGLDPPIPSVANTLTARMSKGVNTTMDEGQTMVPVAIGFDSKRNGHEIGVAPTLRAMGHANSHANAGGQLAVAQPLGAGDGKRGWHNDLDQGAFIPGEMMVRRLMPVECERLQGLPDDWTNVPWRGKDHAPDGPRYKAIGNAWAVPVGRWVARRIQLVEECNV